MGHLFSAILMLAMLSSSVGLGDEAASVVLLRIDDEAIGPGTADYLVQGITDAEEAGAAAVLIELDTNGGLVSSTRDIVQKILDAKLPVLVWVGPSGAHAGSAGTFITMAGHIAAMAPGTNIGAAHPVDMQGQGGVISGQEAADDDSASTNKAARDQAAMEAKVLNDTSAWAESIAHARGRSVAFARDAVRKAISLPANEAVEENAVDFIANSREDLLKKATGRLVTLQDQEVTLALEGRTIREVEKTLRQKVVILVTNPSLLFMLFLLGMAGIGIELKAPGLILPGVAGVLCLVLFFLGTTVVDVNVAGFALIVLAFVCFVLEVYITSAGMLTLGGLACLILGGLLLFDTPDAVFGFRVGVAYIVGVSLLVTGLAAAVGWLVLRTFRSPVKTGSEGMLAQTGEVTSPISPEATGQVFVHGEYWQARASLALPQGTQIRVRAINGLLLEVEPIPTEGGSTPPSSSIP